MISMSSFSSGVCDKPPITDWLLLRIMFAGTIAHCELSMRFVGSSQELPLESYDKTQGKCTEISGEELCHMRRLTKLTTFIRLPNSSSCILRVFAKTYIQLVFFFPLFFFSSRNQVMTNNN